MKKIGRRLTALALALTLTVGAAGRTAFASWALGDELTERTVQLAEGVTLTSQSLWSEADSDLHTEHYLTYTSGGAVRPVVYSGTYVSSTNTMEDAAAEFIAQGCRVAAAVNGGFFNGNGTIVGMLMTEGVIRSLDVDNYALLGFTNDGEVFIEESPITKQLSWRTEEGWTFTVSLAGYNAYRNARFADKPFLYNHEYASSVLGSSNSVSVILRPVDGGVMKMNSELTLEVVSVADTAREGVSYNGVIPDGYYMLYAEYRAGNEWLTDNIRNLVPGRTVTVSVGGVSERWKKAAYAISGLYTLLRDGEIVSDLSTVTNPYTAVGVKADGTAVFYTIDGRQSGYSVGATYEQVALRLQELGCVTAVALDGGGSTSVGATLPGSSEFTILNRPSTSARRINNSILFVVPDKGPTGVRAGAYVSAHNTVVMAGAWLPMTAVYYDTAGYPVEGGLVSAWSSDGGTVQEIDGGAVFSSDIPGIFTVSAVPGGTGALPVRVVDTLSSLRVTREGSSAAVDSLSLMPGDTVDLTASGTWWSLPVVMDDSCVTWEADASVGTIDPSGRFKAAGGSEAASGNITASAGGQTVAIPVTVQAYPFTDIAGHWSADDITRLYMLGITNGRSQPDGTVVFQPDAEMNRGELFVSITRLLRVDTGEYQDVELPFEDAGSIDSWLLPSVRAMYALGMLNGSASGDKLYANVGGSVSREEAMTVLGQVLAEQMAQDLSGFADSDSVSSWARPYVETLVGLQLVKGSSGNLNPKAYISRGEAARLLVEISGLEKAELLPRPDALESSAPETQEESDGSGDPFGGSEPYPDLPGEDTGDPAFLDYPGDIPGVPDQSGEDMGDPVSQDEPPVDPQD